MEVDKNVSESLEKDTPRVPIKTYQWEDVRRSRKKGGYPWTHLSKPPYEGEENPEEYTLEAYRRSRSRSTSTFGDRSPSPYSTHSRTHSSVNINRKNGVPSSSQPNFQIVNENSIKFPERFERSNTPSSNDNKFERSRSLTRDFASKSFQRSKSPSRSFSDRKSESPLNQRRSRSPTLRDNVNSAKILKGKTETMESDKDKENVQEITCKSNETFTKSEEKINEPLEEISLAQENVPSTTKDTRSRMEERIDSKKKLKRRLSVQSSYSRISLTKQSILDRIKSTRKSLRAPKFVKRSKSDVTHEKKPVNTKGRKSVDHTRHPDLPVYIHIPLKPPVGQTDEFSYLEFEENPPPVGQLPDKRNGKKEVFGDERDGSPIVGLILEYDDGPDKSKSYSNEDMKEIISKMGHGANVQQIDAKDLFPEITEQSAKIKEIVDSIEEKARIVATDGKDVLEEVEVSNKAEVLKKLKQVENGSVTKENTNSTSDVNQEFLTCKPDEDNVSQYLEKEEPIEITESSKTESGEFGVFKTTKPLKGNELEVPSGKRKQRARSEEPPSNRKRKHSIDSSYSRKSLSKLAFLQKIKNFTDKIKIPSFKKQEKTDEAKRQKQEKVEEINQKTNDEQKPKKGKKNQEPKYIFIPLKPPEGETDEFSKYADESAADGIIDNNQNDKELQRQDTELSEDSPQRDVHIIILTPPSDDEVLDGSYPETPSETDQKFFENMQIDNLKHLAKKVVDEVYPESNQLQTVQEEKSDFEDSPPKIIPEITDKEVVKIEDEPKQEDKLMTVHDRIIVDEEDGLKLSEAEVQQEIQKETSSEAKSTEDVVKIKKKVLFKNKKKTDDGEYEYINIPDSERNSIVEEINQDADVFQIKEDVKLEEGHSRKDGTKWSEIDDHEYEPVNPPPEEMAHNFPPQIYVTPSSSLNKIHHEINNESRMSSTTSLERQHLGGTNEDEDLSLRKGDILEAALTSQELQDRIEEEFFKSKPETNLSKSDANAATIQVESFTMQTTTSKPESSETNEVVKVEEPPQQSKRFNEAFKHQTEALKAQAEKIKQKFQNLKKPNISLPQKPNFKMPKLGDRTKIHMPSFKKNSEKRSSLQQRQYSTESNVGEPKKHFDFGTFPKLFDRSKKGRKGSLDDFDGTKTSSKSNGNDVPQPDFATFPKVSRKKGPVGSRWANKFQDIEFADKEQEEQPKSIRISLHEDVHDVPSGDGSHIRYNQDIELEVEFDRENREIHQVSPFSNESLRRWEQEELHGEFPTDFRTTNGKKVQVTDLDEPQTPPELGLPPSNGLHSSGSLSDHRQGVIEEIDSDEFFLRQKGISQEDIEVGKYLSSEIREAFRNPLNLSALERNEVLNIESDQSLQEPPPRKKPSRKQKRKKTPHVSNENISFDRDSVTEIEEYRVNEMRSYPPSRPKRKNKKSKKDQIPYQETISVDEENYDMEENMLRRIESDILPDNILNEDVNGFDGSYPQMYENEHMKDINQPEITISDTCYRINNGGEAQPAPPPRKHKSLKSINVSERDSIFEDTSAYKEKPMEEVFMYRGEHEYIIPTPEPPTRSRKTRSRSQSCVEDDRFSLASENLIPVVEEICVKDIRDSSGYAIVDKQKPRDPPLPPSRFPTTPPRKRRVRNIEKTKVITQKFFTVPRSQPQSQNTQPPERPHRNYSTLSMPTKPARKKSLSASQLDSDEKENIDLSQYMEINEEPVRRLQSGEIVQKMKSRPLPAPPRPPRRLRDDRETLQDITNIEDDQINDELEDKMLDETEVSTQTEPLPDDFECEPLTREETDKIILPSDDKSLRKEESFEETITHASMVVQPINDSNILPFETLKQHKHSKETIIPTKVEESDEETSEIPEDFKKLKSPPVKAESPREKILDSSAEIELLKTQKLQVTDLDIDKLRVNQLEANKIIVSEIEGLTIQVNEINSRSGNLVVSGIELPSNLIQELVEKLQSVVNQRAEQSEETISQPVESENTLKNVEEIQSENVELEETKIQENVDLLEKKESQHLEQKKTSIEYFPGENIVVLESIFFENPEPVTVQNLETLEENDSQSSNKSETEQVIDHVPPQRPPRKSSVVEEEKQSKVYSDSVFSLHESVKDVEDLEKEEIPFPLPEYVPSQPPPSFFALRSQPFQDFFDEAIPMPPHRRKRHLRSFLVRESSSEDDPTPPRRERTPELSIPQLAGQLTRACAQEAETSIRRLIAHFSENVFRNNDGKQDAHVMVILLLVLIAGILLLSGDPNIVIHHHHWEYFNPPRDL